MRINRNTVIFLVAAVAVIILALALINNQASAPGTTTPTPSAVLGGPLFPELDTSTQPVTTLIVRDNVTGVSQRYDRATADAEWVGSSTVALNQNTLSESAGTFAQLDANDTFESADLAQFGLDTPAYSIFAVQRETDTAYILHVGTTNFNNTRYYVTADTVSVDDLDPSLSAEATDVGAGLAPPADATAESTDVGAGLVTPADATAEATPEVVMLVILDGTRQISTLPTGTVEGLLALLYPPLAPTPTPTFEVTPEATTEATDAGAGLVPPADATAEITAESANPTANFALTATAIAESVATPAP
jgi:hypothetical protein